MHAGIKVTHIGKKSPRYTSKQLKQSYELAIVKGATLGCMELYIRWIHKNW